jgi:hypothetical protein
MKSLPESLLEVREHNGPDYKPLIDFQSWRVALMNYTPDLLPEKIYRLVLKGKFPKKPTTSDTPSKLPGCLYPARSGRSRSESSTLIVYNRKNPISREASRL